MFAQREQLYAPHAVPHGEDSESISHMPVESFQIRTINHYSLRMLNINLVTIIIRCNMMTGITALEIKRNVKDFLYRY